MELLPSGGGEPCTSSHVRVRVLYANQAAAFEIGVRASSGQVGGAGVILSLPGGEQHVGDPFPRLAVPQLRTAHFYPVAQNPARLPDYPFWVSAHKHVCARRKGDRAFGVVPQGETRHPEDSSLLLHASGVREYHPGGRLEREEVDLTQWPDKADRTVRRE